MAINKRRMKHRVFVRMPHSHVTCFFKADLIFSLVECIWTLKKVVVDKNLCSWQKLPSRTNSNRLSLHSKKRHILYFSVPCDIFMNAMLWTCLATILKFYCEKCQVIVYGQCHHDVGPLMIKLVSSSQYVHFDKL